MNENLGLEEGFRCARIPELRKFPYPEVDPYELEVLKHSEFRTWDEFPSLVSSTKTAVTREIRRQGCYPNSQSQDCCSGAFRNAECGHKTCNLVARYKEYVRDLSPLRTPKGLHKLFGGYLLHGLVRLAKKIDSNWSGYPRHRSHLYLDTRFTHEIRYVKPSFSIRQNDEDEKYSDTVITLLPPSGIMLPSLTKKTFSSLAAMYQHDCMGITDESRFPYHVRCMGALAKAAFFSKSGYGCMCNHNEAVFIKVSLKETSPGAQPKHIISVSKAYKCDNPSGSVFDGLLAIMLLGCRKSSTEKQRELHRHLCRLIYRTPDPMYIDGNSQESHSEKSHSKYYGDAGAGPVH